MKNHHRDFAHLRVVQSVEQHAHKVGTAMVFGPFPPLTSPSSDHASAMLHVLKTIGYKVVSATGPGLALAGHQLNFTSNGRFKTSTKFLTETDTIALSVIYARSAEFARISKPSWHSRRLEELRRIKFIMRAIDAAEKTCLILENHPLKSRDEFCFWAVAQIWSRWRGKKLQVQSKKRAVSDVLHRLTGHREATPSNFVAEASAYEAAFDTLGPQTKIRLTCTRSSQCAQSWAAKMEPGRADAVVSDLKTLVSVFRRHDLRAMPQFRLLWQSLSPAPATRSYGSSPALKKACELDPTYQKFDLPITRYMTHLRKVLGREKDFPLTTRAEARKFLNWSIWEAGAATPDKRLPISQEIVDFIAAGSKSFSVLDVPTTHVVSHTIGRDNAPFPLTSYLSEILQADTSLSEKYDIANPLDRIGFALEVLLRLPADADPRTILGSAACNWFTKPIGGNGLCLTRLEYLLALTTRFELAGATAAERPWEEDAIRTWVRTVAYSVFPALRRLSASSKPSVALRHSLVISGLPKSQTGVGSNLRMSFEAFRTLGVSAQVHDVADGLATVDMGPRQLFGRSLNRSVNLHHMNADAIPQVLTAQAFAQAGDAYNIGYLLWEFDVLPDTHRLALDMLDEIWVPTSFLADAYGAATSKPVHVVKKGIRVPRISPVNLSDFGIEGEAITFLSCFDFHSSVARKNPMASVRAFQDAFPLDRCPDVRLIIKTTPVETRHWGDPERQMAQIETAVAADPRMTVMAEHLPFNRLLGLIAASDCLLSPHRAEGFGLMPAYALAMSKPVISTDYSGSTDFCTQETAIPLPYRLVDVAANQVLHPMKGARWANVDHDAFVAALRDVAANTGPARKRALRGSRLIETEYSPNAQAARYAARLRAIGALT